MDNDQTKTPLIQNIDELLKDAETLIDATTTDHADQGLSDVRARMTKNLARAREELETVRKAAGQHARASADKVEHYTKEQPWTALGVAVGVGVLVGALLRRR